MQIAVRYGPWKISSGADKSLSAANSQAGQAEVIIDLISALWRVSLMLELKRSLLNREQILTNILNALVSIISMCSFHVIVNDNGDIPSIQCKMSLRRLSSIRKGLKTNFFNITYNELVRTSQEIRYVSAIETNRLMLVRETIAVYCENHTQCTITLFGENAGFGMIRKVVPILTTGSFVMLLFLFSFNFR
jgi:hypothetical protein